jgi:heme-degrading monooxygenase HmoA
MSSPATTQQPPYYAVIFTSIRTDGDNGYGEIAKHMVELAAKQPGFLGVESARQEIGITVSYWSSLEAIKAWKENLDHRQARSRAKDWYVKLRCDLKSRFYFCFTGGNYELMKPVVPSTVPYPDMRSR